MTVLNYFLLFLITSCFFLYCFSLEHFARPIFPRVSYRSHFDGFDFLYKFFFTFFDNRRFQFFHFNFQTRQSFGNGVMLKKPAKLIYIPVFMNFWTSCPWILSLQFNTINVYFYDQLCVIMTFLGDMEKGGNILVILLAENDKMWKLPPEKHQQN